MVHDGVMWYRVVRGGTWSWWCNVVKSGGAGWYMKV